MRPIAIVQHEHAQGPGFLQQCLHEQGYVTKLFNLAEGQALPLQARDYAGIAAPHGYADLLILGASAELPALQRLGLIAPAGTGLWRVLGLSRHGGASQPLAVAMASAQAAAQVLSSRLPRLCISTRSFGLP